MSQHRAGVSPLSKPICDLLVVDLVVEPPDTRAHTPPQISEKKPSILSHNYMHLEDIFDDVGELDK